MADEIKISELPAVVTPAGNDTLPVVQSGITKKETVTQIISGNNIVTGPGTSTDDAIARYNGTGNIVQNSGATIDDSGNITAPGLTLSTTPLAVSSGGTGRATLTNHGVLIGAATTGITQLGAGSVGQVLQSGGASADPAYSTATYPATATGTGTVLRANGTNWSASTSTFADTYGINTILYAGSANTVSGLATANNAVLATNATGVPALTTFPITVDVHVSAQGNNTTAVFGSTLLPYATVAAACAAIVSAGDFSATKNYNIILHGVITETAATPPQVPPFTHITGDGSVWNLNGNTLTYHAASWGAAGQLFTCNNVDFTSHAISFNFKALADNVRRVRFFNCKMGAFTGGADSAQSVFEFFSTAGWNLSIGSGGSLIANGGSYTTSGGNPWTTVAATTSNGTTAVQFIGCSLGSSISIDSSGGGVGALFVAGCDGYNSNTAVTLTGALAFYYTPDSSIPIAQITVNSGANILPKGDAQWSIPGFTPSNYTPAANPTGFSVSSVKQHLQGIDTKFGAYSFSGTDSTFGVGNIFAQRSASGGSVGVLANNLSNTASSDAFLTVGVAGSAAGDPYTAYGIAGGGQFAQGIDNSDSDKFKRTATFDLNSNVYEVVTSAGEITYPLQPAFSAYLAASVNDKTGTGTSYQLGTDALTEVFDQNSDFNTNGTFTAPVAGRYQLNTGCRVTGCTVATVYNLTIHTSNRGYQILYNRAAANNNFAGNISILADMDAGDTAVVAIAISGEAADTDDIQGGSALLTYFNGYLAC